MAIAVAMNNNQEDNNSSNSNHEDDEHENDVVMPGFRFHPTEEELVEFYLRREVEGKRFNVELITFLDLYRYDPWELPALAAIGEKEWYFYVPRDRKYRNGDRPNRVTTSGYWKATGADRMIRSDQNSSRSIGLKKTLVFYSGKAPKGIRTSWIMNEYRLPHHETERLQKAEISLCRVYKRAGVEDHPSLPRSVPTSRGSSSSSRVSQPPLKPNELPNHQPMEGSSFQRNYTEMSQQKVTLNDTSPSSSNDVATSLSLSKQHTSSYTLMSPLIPMAHSSITPSNLVEEDHHRMILNQSSVHAIDDLHKLVSNYSQYPNKVENHPLLFSTFQPDPRSQSQHPPPPQTQPMTLNVVSSPAQGGFSDRLWDWNGISEAGKDYNNLFK